uniref:Reverse transcriptase domain-containing protein n=1 Tax=Solanum lycopersicum TaxID=4081 RepID=A0A3Q7ED62_SOLLC
MPFGLTNAPATFCTLINEILHPYLDQFVVVYLDDIIVYSSTLQEYVEHLKKVFKVLRENQLYVKREKCEFAQPKIHFLGHMISQGELRMDEAKVKAIQDWEAPTKVTELCSFLGLANYYCRFIIGYSAIAAPLTELLKKNRPWLWSEECQGAFEGLKAAVIQEPVLMLPDFTKTFEIHTDASDFAIGGIIFILALNIYMNFRDNMRSVFNGTKLRGVRFRLKDERDGEITPHLPTPSYESYSRTKKGGKTRHARSSLRLGSLRIAVIGDALGTLLSQNW